MKIKFFTALRLYRLFRFSSFPLVVALLLVSCGGTGTQSFTTRVSITISPNSTTLAAGATQTFSAAIAGTSNVAVTWNVQEASGGTISSTGFYTAPTISGTYHVIVTSQADTSKTASATITVPVISLNLTPPVVSMAAGETQSFTATVIGAVDQGVSWSIPEGSPSGGLISATGVYVAPRVFGIYHVVGTSQVDSTRSATATITVFSRTAVW